MLLQSRLVVALALLPVCAPVCANAQKKPVTIDAITRQGPGGFGFSANWAPDGKRFVYRQGARLMLYDAASKSEKPLLATSALEAAAVKVPPAEAFGWENRRVREEPMQWAPDGKNLIALSGGDVFLIKVEAGGWIQLTATPIAERDPKLSPDGRKLAYRHNHDLYLMDLDSKRVTRLTTDGSSTLLNGELDWVYPEELALGTAYWWSPDSRAIAYLQFDISREMIHPHVDMLDVFARPEPQRYPKAGTPNADVRLGVVAAGGGATRWMELGETRDRLLARVQWLPDSKGLLVHHLNRVQNELRLVHSDLKTGQPTLILTEKDAAWVNIKDDLFLLPSREQFIFGSERDGYRHLYLMDKKAQVVNAITKGDFEVTGVVRVDEAGGRVYFQSTEESPLERHLYVASLNGGERRKLTKVKGTHTVSVSPTGEYWIDTFSSINDPSRTVLRGAGGEAIATLRAPDLKPQQEYNILPTEFVQFKGSDGTLFYARMIKPANFQAGRKYPAVVMVYGGPHVQTVRDSYAGLSWDQVLAHRGFVIWQMDNRGSAGRGHKWEAQVNRNLGQLEVKDQVEGVKHLVSMGFVDPNRVGVHGWSYGGYMTLQCLLQAPDTFVAGVSGAPVTDWRHYDTIYTERYMGLPGENEKGYRDGSPVHFAANLKGKLMLVHNFGDDNVLYQNNMQMQMALQRAGKHFELLVYPQKSHGVTGPLSRHMREAMTDFFVRALNP
ncbi:MAG: DPP IV N-terminal domain-containing protein [Acidobacteria bacterium]|nr:DPP IV N-terminal domain-containing protein [Acidobacteriota bacterium]